MMIGLDTNVLARYYVIDQSDAEAMRQRPLAQRLIESDKKLAVSKTVILELEWLLRGYYQHDRAQVLTVLHHLLSRTNVLIEDTQTVTRALASYKSGVAFGDALHHASYSNCDSMASFDDRKFARRVAALGLLPPVTVLR